MKLITSVEASYMGAYVRLTTGRAAQLVGVRPPTGWLVTILAPAEVQTAAALERWLARTSAGVPELAPRQWRSTLLVDFLDAVQAEQYLGGVHQRYIAESIAELAHDGAALLRRWIADALELDGNARAAAAGRLAGCVRRYAAILRVADAPGVLDEIRRQPDVEQLMALDNAVVQWSATPVAPADRRELVKETRVLADIAAPGMSTPWHRWMWHLARATSRAELIAVVDAVIADADRRCLAVKPRKKQATVEREEARRLAVALRTATVHQLEIHPPQRDLFGAPLKDPDVFHYVAFVALTQAASAISLAFTAEGKPLDEANLTAMRAIAELALDVLGGA